jgi:8-oxo-dGTP pyrophosphatase MutT (NUDIX family)
VTEPVRAAGGVVCRSGERGGEVLVIHRSRYDDWTLPKGKVEAGERDEDAALREVREETGVTCSLGAELPSVSYTDAEGRPKRVRYWRMEIVAGEAGPGDTVDEVRWLSPNDAAALLSHEREREVVRSL